MDSFEPCHVSVDANKEFFTYVMFGIMLLLIAVFVISIGEASAIYLYFIVLFCEWLVSRSNALAIMPKEHVEPKRNGFD